MLLLVVVVLELCWRMKGKVAKRQASVAPQINTRGQPASQARARNKHNKAPASSTPIPIDGEGANLLSCHP